MLISHVFTGTIMFSTMAICQLQPGHQFWSRGQPKIMTQKVLGRPQQGNGTLKLVAEVGESARTLKKEDFLIGILACTLLARQFVLQYKSSLRVDRNNGPLGHENREEKRREQQENGSF